eukprot:1360867-Amphidinium_carterae.1
MSAEHLRHPRPLISSAPHGNFRSSIALSTLLSVVEFCLDLPPNTRKVMSKLMKRRAITYVRKCFYNLAFNISISIKLFNSGLFLWALSLGESSKQTTHLSSHCSVPP